MLGRTELTIDLDNNFPKKAVLKFIELRQKLYQLYEHQRLVKKEYEKVLEEINDEIIKLKSECKHPHTYLTGGGQYEPQETICSICDKEIE